MKHGNPERTWVPLAHQLIGSAKARIRPGALADQALTAMARDLVAAVEAGSDPRAAGFRVVGLMA